MEGNPSNSSFTKVIWSVDPREPLQEAFLSSRTISYMQITEQLENLGFPSSPKEREKRGSWKIAKLLTSTSYPGGPRVNASRRRHVMRKMI